MSTTNVLCAWMLMLHLSSEIQQNFKTMNEDAHNKQTTRCTKKFSTKNDHTTYRSVRFFKKFSKNEKTKYLFQLSGELRNKCSPSCERTFLAHFRSSTLKYSLENFSKIQWACIRMLQNDMKSYFIPTVTFIMCYNTEWRWFRASTSNHKLSTGHYSQSTTNANV